MPGQPDPRTSPIASDDGVPSPLSLPTSRLTSEQVQRWAELIADGRNQFPADLPPPDRDWLLVEVRRRRRDRLVQHIVRAIALDLRGEARPD